MGGYNITIFNKLSKWEASAHYVDDTIDTGEIITTFRFDFDYRFETAQSLEKNQTLLCDLYKSVNMDVFTGKDLTPNCISNTGGINISRQEMNAMKKIDPEKDDIALKARSFWFPPYTAAYVEIQGKAYTIVDEFMLSQLREPDQTAL